MGEDLVRRLRLRDRGEGIKSSDVEFEVFGCLASDLRLGAVVWGV